MFKHLFKLIWNKKKQNFLLMSEMLFSFLVLFAVFTLLVYYYDNYKKPMGFEYQNVWVISYNNAYQTKSTDSLNTYYEILRQNIKAMPEVRELSFCSFNTPFTNNMSQGRISYHKKPLDHVNFYTADESFPATMNMQILEGRWFNKTDVATKNKPIVINSDIKEQLFGKGAAVGQLISNYDEKEKMRVIGVVQSIKMKGDYAATGYGLYQKTDTGSLRWMGKIMVQVVPGASAAFEGHLYKTLANYMKNSNVEIEHLTNKRTSINYFTLVPMIVLSIVGGFLAINVALGLFGVLWYNINQRRGEIGLRRAVGASGGAVSSQLIYESMILATLSLIVGSFFAVQFPLLNVFDLSAGIYISAMLLAITFIYALVFLCSLYPGRQAAAIYPAVALHEE
ncbi:putative ABC transport system permease protein [Mucilaginibacter lappiensis]|uniref:ABC transport system permease protein n=1 Tax=Mucilaginibacter lappiensis TaxID=354630 RepID=A0ABR6PKG0_9SPHI|nr:ABC transporter permease [Mucilaginibacter lappiensis]MBB6110098.1 putative ABC transport system permease protein [Mucilaginibacter lappiensis]SIR53107.1 putative ABC transport system permease protein [Mucilaginibacter lappiensis]